MEELIGLLIAMDNNMKLAVENIKAIYKRLDGLNKRLTFVEQAILDDPCTCTPDGPTCPSCQRRTKSTHPDNDPLPY